MNVDGHSDAPVVYRFGPFRFIPSEYLLQRGEKNVRLFPVECEVLCLLIERRPNLVTYDEVLDTVWPLDPEKPEKEQPYPGRVNVAIAGIKKAFKEKEYRRYIETVRKKRRFREGGFRFVGEVEEREEIHNGNPATPGRISERLLPEPTKTETLVSAVTRDGGPATTGKPLPEPSPAPNILQQRDAENPASPSSIQEKAVSESTATLPPASTASLDDELAIIRNRVPKSGLATVPSQERDAGIASQWMRLLGAVLAVLLAVGIWVLIKKFTSGSPQPGAVAVLPFTLAGNTVGDEDLGVATADTITTKLGIAGIPVRPLSAVQRYNERKGDPQDFARKLGADFVVDGSIQYEGERIRLIAHLTRVKDDVQLWATNLDGKRTEIFALQDAIARKIAEVIGPKLTDQQNRLLVRHSTENDEAYLAYESGRYHWNKRTLSALEQAEKDFQQAKNLDSGYALAHSGLADTYSMQALYGGGVPKDLYPKAREEAKKALELDENSAEAHASLGLVYLYYDWDGPAAEAEFKRSLAIDPNYSHVHMWQGLNFTAMGRFSEGEKELERARELDPLSPIINAASGIPFCYQGKYSQAIERARKGLELDPNFPRPAYYLGIFYEHQGLHRQAIAELEEAVRLSGGNPEVRFPGGNPEYEGLLGYAYAMAGETEKARSILDDLKQRPKRGQFLPAFAIALIYKALGERERTFEWLEKARDDRFGWMIYLKIDPLLNDLRSDPRFKRLEEQIKFPNVH